MKIFSAILTLLWACNLQAQKTPITRYYSFSGTIDKYPVTFHLHRTNNDFTGNYYYNSSEKPIDISGSMDSKGFLKLTHTAEKEKENEIIEGVFKDSSFSGSWQSKGKMLPFRATRNLINPNLTFDYIWSHGAKKIKKKAAFLQHIDSIFYDSKTVWPSAGSTHPAKPLIEDIIRKCYGVKNNKDPIGKIMVEQKNKMLNGESSEDGIETYESSDYVDIVYSNANFICLAQGWSNYSGGAHGNYGTNYLTIDLINNKEMLLADIFDTTTAKEPVQKLLEKIFLEKYKEDDFDTLEEILLVAVIPMTENFLLTSKGIGFNYPPYAIGPYALGEVFLYIPFRDLQSWLKPSFKKMIGLSF